MIFLALTKFFSCKDFSLISLWNWNLSTYVGVQFIFFKNESDPIQFEVFVLVPELPDLGFVRETLIFKTWNILDIIG